jgi:hypothetical protein
MPVVIHQAVRIFVYAANVSAHFAVQEKAEPSARMFAPLELRFFATICNPRKPQIADLESHDFCEKPSLNWAVGSSNGRFGKGLMVRITLKKWMWSL